MGCTYLENQHNSSHSPLFKSATSGEQGFISIQYMELKRKGEISLAKEMDPDIQSQYKLHQLHTSLEKCSLPYCALESAVM